MKIVHILTVTVLVLFIKESCCNKFNKIEELLSKSVQPEILLSGLENGNQDSLEVSQSKFLKLKVPLNFILDAALYVLRLYFDTAGYNKLPLSDFTEQSDDIKIIGTNGTLEDLVSITRSEGKDSYAKISLKSLLFRLPVTLPNAVIDYAIIAKTPLGTASGGIKFRMDLEVDTEITLKFETLKFELTHLKVGPLNIRDIQARGDLSAFIEVIQKTLKENEPEIRATIAKNLKDTLQEIIDLINSTIKNLN